MKKRLPISRLAAAALAVCPIVSSTAWAEVKTSSSGKIQLEIDPSQPNFKIEDIEANIRRMAEGMNLPADQKAGLEQSLKELRESVKPGPDGPPKRFSWKWEFSSDQPPAQQKPDEQRSGDGFGRRNRGAGEQQDGQLDPRGYRQWLERMKDQLPGGQGAEGAELRDLFKQMFGGNADMDKLMEEMMKKFGQGQPFRGQQQSPDGTKRFFFRMGPNGLEQGQGNGEDKDEAELPWQQLGGHDHGPDHVYDPDKAPRDSKYSRATLAEFRGAVRDARKSTVSILREGRSVSFGLVATTDGFVLTKSSELGKGNLECEFMDGSIHPAKVVDRLDTYDLALLKIDGAANLTPAKFKSGDLPVGTMLAAAGIDEDPVAVGVVSVPPRNLDDSQKGFLGLQLGETKDGSGVLIINVVQDSPASKAQLEPGNVVLSIDGEAVKNPHELMKRVGARKPGESLKLRVKDADAEEDVAITLASREEFGAGAAGALDPTARMGSNLSGKSSGFPSALQCDLGINANQCGGAVVDIEGNIVGVNIARAGRTSTYVIPAKTITDLLADAGAGKLAFAKDPALLERDVRRYEAELKKAEDSLKAVQDKLKEAREAHEKARK